MKAWVIDKVSDLTKENNPLIQIELPKPVPEIGEVLIKMHVCGVCHTEIDEIEGRTPPPVYPVVPGHQGVGVVEENKGTGTSIKIGDRVGVAWIYSACGVCDYCQNGLENLCEDFKATGRDVHGAYGEYMVIPEKYVYKIPDCFTDNEAAPLLCAGAIGYRSLKLCELKNGQNIGLTGFGASAHIVLKLIKYLYPNSHIYVFARQEKERDFACNLGANWSGDTTDSCPVMLDAIIDTTPVWNTVLCALESLKPGGRLVINAIRKEHIDQEYLLNLDYTKHLWMEKEIKSVANITSSDVRNFINIAAEINLKPEVEVYPYDKANKALMDIKKRRIKGAKVLRIID